MAAGVLKAAHHQQPGRQDQEHERKDEEGDNTQPGPRHPADPRRGRGKRSNGGVSLLCHEGLWRQDIRRGYFTFAPTTLSHCFVIICLARSCCSSDGNSALEYATAGGSVPSMSE